MQSICLIWNVLLMLSCFSKAMSVLKIEYPDTMDETKTRVKVGGLLDPRLGTIGMQIFNFIHSSNTF